MLWHDQQNGLPEIKLWDDCGKEMRRWGPEDAYVTGCGRPLGHDGPCSIYACAKCGGVLNVEPDLRDPSTGDTTKAHAAHACDAKPHPLSLDGRAEQVRVDADVRLFESPIDPWVLRGEVDGRTPRHDPHFFPVEVPIFLGCFGQLDVWATRDRFHAVIDEGTGFGWPRPLHRSPSQSHRTFMLKTIRNYSCTAMKLWMGKSGEFRTESDYGPAKDLLEEIEAAIDEWLKRQAH